MISKGLGDSLHKLTTKTGIKAAVDKAVNAVGGECGCSKRRNALNELIPYTKK